MISNYVTFNVKKFVKDYYRYRALIPELEAKLESILYPPPAPIDADKVQVTPDGSKTERLALQRITLAERLADYRTHVQTCEQALQALTDEEKEVIRVFFDPEIKEPATDVLQSKGYSKSTAYNIRGQALDKIAEIVSGVKAK